MLVACDQSSIRQKYVLHYNTVNILYNFVYDLVSLDDVCHLFERMRFMSCAILMICVFVAGRSVLSYIIKGMDLIDLNLRFDELGGN